MTGNIEERLTALLEAATMAEDEAKLGLRQMAKEILKTRIEKGDEGIVEKLMDLVMMSGPIIFPQRRFAQDVAEGAVQKER